MTEEELIEYGEELKEILRCKITLVDIAIQEAIEMRKAFDIYKKDPEAWHNDENSLTWHEDIVANAADDVGVDAYEFRLNCLEYARND